LDTPVISPNFFSIKPKMKFAETPPVLQAKNYDELETHIISILEDKNNFIETYFKKYKDSFKENFAYKFDGLASYRIADVIKKQC